MIFFTSDQHAMHKNVCRLCRRPWPQEDNTEQLVTRWNHVVGVNDMVYVLGDFCFSSRVHDWIAILTRLNGTIKLIEGNHDHRALTKFKQLCCCDDRLVAAKDDGNPVDIIHHPRLEIEIDKQPIVLDHYSLRSWNRASHGAYHLFGHSHGAYEGQDTGLSVDVGVDVPRWNYAPVSWDQIRAYMAAVKFEREKRNNNEQE